LSPGKMKNVQDTFRTLVHIFCLTFPREEFRRFVRRKILKKKRGKKVCQFGPAAWPAIADIYIYIYFK